MWYFKYRQGNFCLLKPKLYFSCKGVWIFLNKIKEVNGSESSASYSGPSGSYHHGDRPLRRQTDKTLPATHSTSRTVGGG